MASRNYINYDLKHARKDGLKNFAWGTVNIRIGKTDYSADVIVGNNGTRLYLYDVINLKEIKIKERRSNQSAVFPKRKDAEYCCFFPRVVYLKIIRMTIIF